MEGQSSQTHQQLVPSSKAGTALQRQVEHRVAKQGSQAGSLQFPWACMAPIYIQYAITPVFEHEMAQQRQQQQQQPQQPQQQQQQLLQLLKRCSCLQLPHGSPSKLQSLRKGTSDSCKKKGQQQQQRRGRTAVPLKQSMFCSTTSSHPGQLDNDAQIANRSPGRHYVQDSHNNCTSP
ncbi:unnamed protein product [Polarella glacialis]|uniref:Uncharacterized protein n=1 Tax=Polarella glacialis TaxID=89957 RepID=A0A813DYS9_POLGL|nr:unnamed protein product [Polarella glacialis]